MLNTHELRIGNWVNFYNDGTIFKVIDISSAGIGVENPDEETWIELDQFQPIPLTPEVLEKCGFEVNKYAASLRINGGYLYFNIESKSFGIAIENSEFDVDSSATEELSTPLLHVKYLHQVQNLFFALTQTELEYKP